MDFCIRIANQNILIHSMYSSVHRVYKDYLINDYKAPEIEIHVDNQLINMELKTFWQSGIEIPNLAILEEILIHRSIAEALLDYDTFLMHGAVIAVDDRAYMFSGKSGIGKTTHIKKWLKNAVGSYVVNGDKPMIAVNSGGIFACGTPWCGKEYLGINTIVPLRSIVIMERSEENHIEQISFKSILPKLLEQTYQPTDVQKMRKTLELLGKLKDQVSFYRFSFNNLKEDAFQTSYKALVEQGSNEKWID